ILDRRAILRIAAHRTCLCITAEWAGHHRHHCHGNKYGCDRDRQWNRYVSHLVLSFGVRGRSIYPTLRIDCCAISAPGAPMEWRAEKRQQTTKGNHAEPTEKRHGSHSTSRPWRLL